MAAATVAHCYEPVLVDCTVACGAGNACPSGQRCDHGFCSAATNCESVAENDGSVFDADAGIDTSIDVSLDGRDASSPLDDVSADGLESRDTSSEVATYDASSETRSSDASIDVRNNVTDGSPLDAGYQRDAYPTTAAPCQPLPLPFPSTPVLDDMNRTELGPKWHMPGPTTVVLDGTKVSVTGPADAGWRAYDLLFEETFSGAQEAYVTALSFDNAYLALKLRAQQPYCDLIMVSYTPGVDVAATLCRGGYWWEFQRQHAVLKVGDVLGARLQANGCLEVYVGGTLLYAVDAAPFIATLNDPSHIGVWAYARAGATSAWDDFGGGSVP